MSLETCILYNTCCCVGMHIYVLSCPLSRHDCIGGKWEKCYRDMDGAVAL